MSVCGGWQCIPFSQLLLHAIAPTPHLHPHPLRTLPSSLAENDKKDEDKKDEDKKEEKKDEDKKEEKKK